jgi:uncharacterized integral membrane protein
MLETSNPQPEIYQGQFGQFTITESDRKSVIVYRAALMVSALCFSGGVAAVIGLGTSPEILNLLTWLYAGFCLALGVALAVIHIYMAALHRALQAFWAVGCIAAIACVIQYPEPLALTVYQHPVTIVGIGFTFAALTGIFFKEAFCFNRFETKFLTILVPFLLLGHLIGKLPIQVEQILLEAWACLFFIFAIRKVIQAIPPDIGDKTVFDYLKSQQSGAA